MVNADAQRGGRGGSKVWRWLRRWWWAVYLALVLASQVVQWTCRPNVYSVPVAGENKQWVELAAQSNEGPVEGRTVRIAYFDVPATGPKDDTQRPTVLLLHGTPGDSADFSRMWPNLQAAGYRVVAVDMPGFGASSPWPPCYSMRAYARTLLELMERLGIPSAHVVGWSNGGGVALNMADLAPQRTASITLLASIGDQANEGSGDYFFEHVKYAAGFPLIVGVPEVLPHFGLLGRTSWRYATVRNFWDSDQRPLRGIMQKLSVPTLILHGRDDFLVADWAALRHHDLMPRSELVLIDGDHFMPFMAPENALRHLLDFFERYDAPGAPAQRRTTILATPRGSVLGAWGDRAADFLIDCPWWLPLIVTFALAIVLPRTTTVLAASLIPTNHLDFGIAILALSTAAAVRNVWEQRKTRPPMKIRRVFAAAGWALVRLIIASVMIGGLAWHMRGLAGPAGFFAVMAAALGILVLMDRFVARLRRRRATATAAALNR